MRNHGKIPPHWSCYGEWSTPPPAASQAPSCEYLWATTIQIQPDLEPGTWWFPLHWLIGRNSSDYSWALASCDLPEGKARSLAMLPQAPHWPSQQGATAVPLGLLSRTSCCRLRPRNLDATTSTPSNLFPSLPACALLAQIFSHEREKWIPGSSLNPAWVPSTYVCEDCRTGESQQSGQHGL